LRRAELNPLTVVTLKSWDMEHEPIVQMGSARMLPGYMCCKPFTVNAGICAGVYRWSLRRSHSFILGFHTTVFQAEVYAIKACIMKNIEKDYKLENLYSF
jgi:hypothetical protein